MGVFFYICLTPVYLPLVAYLGGAADRNCGRVAAVVTLRRNVPFIFPSRNLALKGGALCMNSARAFVFFGLLLVFCASVVLNV